MPDTEPSMPLSQDELKIVERIAKRDGITTQEAAIKLAQDGLSHRVKKRTGKSPARVYSLPKK